MRPVRIDASLFAQHCRTNLSHDCPSVDRSCIFVLPKGVRFSRLEQPARIARVEVRNTERSRHLPPLRGAITPDRRLGGRTAPPEQAGVLHRCPDCGRGPQRATPARQTGRVHPPLQAGFPHWRGRSQAQLREARPRDATGEGIRLAFDANRKCLGYSRWVRSREFDSLFLKKGDIGFDWPKMRNLSKIDATGDGFQAAMAVSAVSRLSRPSGRLCSGIVGRGSSDGLQHNSANLGQNMGSPGVPFLLRRGRSGPLAPRALSFRFLPGVLRGIRRQAAPWR